MLDCEGFTEMNITSDQIPGLDLNIPLFIMPYMHNHDQVPVTLGTLTLKSIIDSEVLDGSLVSHGGLVVSKHGLYVGGLGSIPIAITTRTAAGGDAGYVFLNHQLSPPNQGVKLVPAKCLEDSYRHWP